MRRNFLLLALVLALHHAACGAGYSTISDTSPESVAQKSPEKTDTMKISLKIKDRVLSATLVDGKTTRDFVSLLPLTLTMNDLFGREKYGHLPRELSEGGARTHSYHIGDVAYWSPGPDVAIFYRHDGQSIPAPGIIVIGNIDYGVEALNVDGSIKVTIELAGQSFDQSGKLECSCTGADTGGSSYGSAGIRQIHRRPFARWSLEASRSIVTRPQHYYCLRLDCTKSSDRDASPF
jgi:hypothetical protein